MSQKDVELILARRLASYLAMPIFLVDERGSLVYYNEAAEDLLGLRYEEAGEMPEERWTSLFVAATEDGGPLAGDQLPLVVARRERRPEHREFWIKGLDGRRRHIAVTAFPLEGQHGRDLGAVAIFWEADSQ